jgi:hypothetical protein
MASACRATPTTGARRSTATRPASLTTCASRRRRRFWRRRPILCDLADELLYLGRICVHSLWDDGDTGFAHQSLSVFALFGHHNRDDITAGTRSCSAA